MKILITGVSGLLGNNLVHCYKDKYDVHGIFNDNAVDIKGASLKKLNIENSDEVEKIISKLKPQVIVHCAALVDIEFCEDNREKAYKVNVLGTKNIASAAKKAGAYLIAISTDALYEDGHKETIDEATPVNPVNYYAETKYLAEQEALKGNKDNTVVLRTNIFGFNIRNNKKMSLPEWALGALGQGKTIQGFTDTYFSSMYTFRLADVIEQVIRKRIKGTYNCASRTYLTKFDFLRRIAREFNFNEKLVEPVELNLKAKRSKNLRLNVSKIEKDLGCILPTIEESIDNFRSDAWRFMPGAIKERLPAKYYPVMDGISYGRQVIDEDDIGFVAESLRSVLTQGPMLDEFEAALSKATQSKYAAAVSNGTAALHLACLAVGIKEGDEVVTSTNSFVASANCAVYCGAKPVLADIDPLTYNISLESLQKKINKKTRAIIPVHFAGRSCDMAKIKEIVAKKEKQFGKKIYIIEDGSHALGSSYKNTIVGSCAYSDMVTLSFHPVKHITTSEGGAVLSNNKKLIDQVKLYRSHGIERDVAVTDKKRAFEIDQNTKKKEPCPWYYEQQVLGFNYRIAEMQCALGISQLKKLKAFQRRRNEIIAQYTKAFSDINGITTPVEDAATNFHLYILLIDFKKFKTNRTTLMNALKKKGISTQVHYIPIHTQPFYQKKFKTKWGDYPQAEKYYEKCLSIPLFPNLSDEQVDFIVKTLKKELGIR